MGGDPFSVIALKIGEYRIKCPNSQQDQGCLDQIAHVGLLQSHVDHLADDLRYDQAETGQHQEQDQGD